MYLFYIVLVLDKVEVRISVLRMNNTDDIIGYENYLKIKRHGVVL